VKNAKKVKNLEALSERTGLPTTLFKKAIGISSGLCLAETISEAKDAYENAPNDKAKRVALMKWNRLSLKEIAAAKTIVEIQIVYRNTRTGSKAREAAFAKWDELCTTIDEAMDVYRDAPKDSEAENAAVRKMYDLFSDD
jgi:hypothetical protein